jgi:hypothetical protein
VDFQDFSLLMCVGFTHFLSLSATFFDTKKTHFMTRRFSGCRILSTKECKLHEKQIFFQKIFTCSNITTGKIFLFSLKTKKP